MTIKKRIKGFLILSEAIIYFGFLISSFVIGGFLYNKYNKIIKEIEVVTIVTNCVLSKEEQKITTDQYNFTIEYGEKTKITCNKEEGLLILSKRLNTPIVDGAIYLKF